MDEYSYYTEDEMDEELNEAKESIQKPKKTSPITGKPMRVQSDAQKRALADGRRKLAAIKNAKNSKKADIEALKYARMEERYQQELEIVPVKKSKPRREKTPPPPPRKPTRHEHMVNLGF
jgi:septum formation inhibitor MinC